MQQTKDWTGNSKAIYATHGASNHSEDDRADLDYYATDPEAVEKLLGVEKFFHYILEPACGGGHVAEVLLKHGHDVLCSDIVNRGYEKQTMTADFLHLNMSPRNSRDIITNPPYSKAKEFVDGISDPDDRNIALSEYYYYTGYAEKYSFSICILHQHALCRS